jgi:hypothetical protein
VDDEAGFNTHTHFFYTGMTWRIAHASVGSTETCGLKFCIVRRQKTRALTKQSRTDPLPWPAPTFWYQANGPKRALVVDG